jgi:hypothetical protein
MKFSLQTLIAVTASLALALICLRNLDLGVALLFVVIPFAMALIGLTSPQRGNQLDPSKRWYLFVLAKTWIFALVLLVSFSFAGAISPSLKHRLERAMNGDFRRYQIVILLPTTSHIGDELKGKHWQLYDSFGFVGEVRKVYDSMVFMGYGHQAGTYRALLVSTNREDSKQRDRKEFDVSIRPDGTLLLVD